MNSKLKLQSSTEHTMNRPPIPHCQCLNSRPSLCGGQGATDAEGPPCKTRSLFHLPSLPSNWQISDNAELYKFVHTHVYIYILCNRHICVLYIISLRCYCLLVVFTRAFVANPPQSASQNGYVLLRSQLSNLALSSSDKS